MPRIPRVQQGGYAYHVINRGNGQATVFHNAQDYEAFLSLLAEAKKRHRAKIFGFCLMPNHCDEHSITVLRYVLQNPVRAGLSSIVQQWLWSSLRKPQLVDACPVGDEDRWLEPLDEPIRGGQLVTVRECLNRQEPFGKADWQAEIASMFGLGSRLRPRGRPRNEKKSSLSHYFF